MTRLFTYSTGGSPFWADFLDFREAPGWQEGPEVNSAQQVQLIYQESWTTRYLLCRDSVNIEGLPANEG